MSYAYPPTEQAQVAQIVRQPAFKRLLEIPLLAWQQILFVALCYAVILGGAALYLQGLLPYPVVLLLSGIAIYAVFTPLHDATHRSVSRNEAVNDLIGTLAAQPLIPGATVSLYRYLHLQHHRHTGDPDLDPDESLVSSGPVGRLLNATFVEIKWVHWYLNHLEKRSAREHLVDSVSMLVYVAWHVVWLASPFALEFVLLWMLPQRLGLTVVAYLFAAIQHPEGVLEHERPFQATRMFRGGALTRFLMISQSQHLMHHLFPMVPYYRYNAAWKLSEPVLRKEALVWDFPIGKLAMPDMVNADSNALITVKIATVEQITDEVRAYTFAAAGSQPLPDFEPGAHIDVHIAPGLVRQYSLTGLVSDARYSIAVKREENGRGGSRALHARFEAGQTIQISRPRNLFALQPDDTHAVLIAGGIGITPVLSMAGTLRSAGRSFELHACARKLDMLPFSAMLQNADWAAHTQIWTDAEGGFQAEALPAYKPGQSLYLCGPAGFMEYVRNMALQGGWPADTIHSEAFQAAPGLEENEAFTVELASSGKVIEVAADVSLLDALQANEVPVAASCVQGLCGTCKCRVLEGNIAHRDQFLSDEERATGLMTTCVSRATEGERLLLDL